jgi:hypothetical protein
MLDIECFTYLNKALESPISPIVVLASNRGMATIRGASDLVAAHGIPPDFLSRLLIIPTTPYEPDEIKRIVRIRATTEGVQITDAAIDKIAEHGVRISLRYCLQLLTPSRYVFLFCVWASERFLTETTVSSLGSMGAVKLMSRMSQNARTCSWMLDEVPIFSAASPARGLFRKFVYSLSQRGFVRRWLLLGGGVVLNSSYL